MLLEKLGEGGMAVVYNALDTRYERNVAIKVILPSRQTSQVFVNSFLVEARALAQLSHTNIVKVLDYGEENGQPYLVMEFIPGGTLKEMMGHPIPWQQAAAMLAPVVRALEYIHKQSLVHRDVKPANILIDEHGQPMLSDFGVVKLVEAQEAEVANSVGVGTPDYMSPEQGLGKEINFSADIYALGVVFFEMVTGQKPYAAETPMAVVIKHATEPFPAPGKLVKNLPPAVEKVIFKAVDKNPDKRFQDTGLFAETLEALAQGEKGLKRAEALLRKKIRPAKEEQTKKSTPRRIWVGRAAAALLGIGLGAGLYVSWPWMVSTPIGAALVDYFATFEEQLTVINPWGNP